MMKLILIILITFTLSSFAEYTNEQLFISEDGKEIYLSHNKRTLFTLDTESLKVKNRKWLGFNSIGMDFAFDNKSYLVNKENYLSILDSKDLKEKFRAENEIWNPVIDREKGLIYGLGQGSVVVLDKSLKLKKEFKLPKNFSANAFCISEKKDSFYILSRNDQKKEKKLDYNALREATKEMTDLEELIFEQKNDGKSCKLLLMSLDGKVKKQIDLFYSANDDSATATRMSSYNGNVAIINEGNVHALISAKGEIKLFKTNSRAKSSYFAKDLSFCLSGYSQGVHLTDLKTMKTSEISFQNLISFEDVMDFCIDKNKNIYALTKYSRLLKISPEGKLISITPIF